MRRGFSLLEIVVVLAISAITVGVVLKTTQSSSIIAQADCKATTQTQMAAIRGAIDHFSRNHGRLPLPAQRMIGVDNIKFGHEALANTITQTAGVSFGALPFQALGLAPSYAGDCWGNKLTYAVTTALTTTAGFTSTPLGNMTVKTSLATAGSFTTAAYAVISHGADELGAVKLNEASGALNGIKWCAATSGLRTINCSANAAIIADAPFNDGKNAGADYFDDIVLAGGKPVILGVVPPVTCTFDSTTIANAATVVAYQSATGPCVSETRTCTSTGLTGTYMHATCTPVATPGGNCPAGALAWSQQRMGGSCTAALLSKYAQCQDVLTVVTFTCAGNHGVLTHGQSASVTDADGYGSATADCSDGVVTASDPFCGLGVIYVDPNI